jgi:putative ABC transport system substrate-binding protein
MAYGTDRAEMYRRATYYIDRILRGARRRFACRSTDQYQTILNLKTAKQLGLNVPESLLVRADEVIE